MTNIILCGGSGTRLWPISRTLMPKQFVKLFDGKSLFQFTVERNRLLCDTQMIVSSTDQYFLALDQLEDLGVTNSRYILESAPRNTAPAITLACLALPPSEILLITPSDHLIRNNEEYANILNRARELAAENFLVTFGITPHFPETGFGYIESEGENVRAFHEKPDYMTAQKYLKAGNYYWNSGMFCFKAGIFLEEIKRYAPNIFNACQSAYANAHGKDMIRIQQDDMLAIPEKSIDYAVMEKSDRVKVVASNIEWSDVGSFDALYEEMQKDDNGNTCSERHISIDSHNNLIIAGSRQIATVDINDLIVVDTGDALLISRKGSSQKVKNVVSELKKRDTNLHSIHLTAHRPWGAYTVLEDSAGYKIKRIEVKPGQRLSLQKHFHRNEHWIVLSGTATVTVEKQSYLVGPNESTYIKAGQVHRLANMGKIPLIIIEVQVGEYTGEDDIVRLEDDFNRQLD